MTYESRLRPILDAAKTSRVYVRAQPWQFGKKFLNKEMLTSFQSSLLIRDPRFSLPSYHKIKPDFTEDEAGYQALHTAWMILRQCDEHTPIVDAIDIQRDPVNVVGAWCDEVGIERNESALTWEEGGHQSWGNWTKFTETVVRSTGFQKPPNSFPQVADERVAKMIDSARRYYREMEVYKIAV